MTRRPQKLSVAIEADSTLGEVRLEEANAAASMFDDVAAFNQKFGLPVVTDGPPCPPRREVMLFWLAFMIEELAEFAESQGATRTAADLREVMLRVREFMAEVAGSDGAQVPLDGLADGADGLVDLVWVALNAAHSMRLPFDEHWAEVRRANMNKEKPTGSSDGRLKRGRSATVVGHDVVKPEGWRGPDHWPILYARAMTFNK